jgi:hypothetical protein
LDLEVTVGRRNFYNEKLHNYHASQNIITLIRSATTGLAAHVTGMREMGVHRMFWLETRNGRTICEDLSQTGDNIKMCLKEMGLIRLSQDRDQGTGGGPWCT